MTPTTYQSTFFQKIDDESSLHHQHLAFAEELFALVNRNRIHLSKWLNWVDDTVTVEDTKKFILSTLKDREEGKKYSFVILHQGKIVGTIGFVEIDTTSKWGAIGYWLSEDAQGKGLMTRACKTLIHYGFQSLQLNKIIIEAFAENQASRNIPTRLGFQLDGIFRQHCFYRGQFHDLASYSTLKEKH